MKISIGGHAITMAYLCRFSSFSSRAENGFPDNTKETNPAGMEAPAERRNPINEK